MKLTPLERMYPRRCYDCQTEIDHNDPIQLLCTDCRAIYEREKKRRAERREPE